MITEQEKPPLLSDKEIEKWCENFVKPYSICLNDKLREFERAIKRVDIKWMKGKCYLRAERELPSIVKFLEQIDGGLTALSLIDEDTLRKKFKKFMLKEVDGVSFKAVRKWE